MGEAAVSRKRTRMARVYAGRIRYSSQEKQPAGEEALRLSLETENRMEKIGREDMVTEQSTAIPEAFLERMKKLLGDEYAAFLESYQAKNVQGLRWNPLKGDPEKLSEKYAGRFGLRSVPWCREGCYYEGQTRPGKSPCHEAGIYYIQEPSAMAVVSLLDPRPGERVLDLCAAPGGKTTQIGGRLLGEGLLVSNEIHPARARILSQNVERMGIQNAVVTNEESGKLRDYFPSFFDKIVVDAPCSGEGMFRKNEQAREEWSLEGVALCARRQQEILDNAAVMLKPGGRLVYSTCTFAPEEDEDGIASFLERHPEFTIVEGAGLPGLSAGRPEWAKTSLPALEHTFRIWPHLAEGEGHYLALLEKSGAGEEFSDTGKRKTGTEKERRKAGGEFWRDKAGIMAFQEWMKGCFTEDAWKNWALDSWEDRLLSYGDQIYLLPREAGFLRGLKVLRPGLHLGTLKKNRAEPSHALALALKPEQVRRFLNLDSEGEKVQSYLSGQTIPVPEMENGWVLVCADGYSLGWGKAVSGVLKNHYPKGLRQ